MEPLEKNITPQDNNNETPVSSYSSEVISPSSSISQNITRPVAQENNNQLTNNTNIVTSQSPLQASNANANVVSSNQNTQAHPTIQPTATLPNAVNNPAPTNPQPVATVSSFTPPPTSPSPKKSKKPLFVALMIFLAVILVGSLSAYAYVGVYVPNKPNNVVKQATVNAMSPETLKGLNFTLTVTDKNNPDSSSVISVTAGSQNNLVRADVKAEISAFKITGSVLADTTNESFYIKINELPSLLSILGADDGSLSKAIGNKWIKISPKDLGELGYADQNSALTNNSCIASATKVLSSDQFKQQVIDIYQKNEFINAQKVGSFEVNGKKVTKYKLNVTQQSAEKFVNSSIVAFEKQLYSLDNACAETSSRTTEDSINATDDTNIGDVYVWVGPKKQIEKLEINFSDSEANGKLEVSFNQSNKLDFTVPTNVTTIDSLQKEMQKLYGSPFLEGNVLN